MYYTTLLLLPTPTTHQPPYSTTQRYHIHLLLTTHQHPCSSTPHYYPFLLSTIHHYPFSTTPQIILHYYTTTPTCYPLVSIQHDTTNTTTLPHSPTSLYHPFYTTPKILLHYYTTTSTYHPPASILHYTTNYTTTLAF